MSQPNFPGCKGKSGGGKDWKDWENITDVAQGFARHAEQVVFGKRAPKDTCQPMRFRAKVPPLKIPAVKQ